MKQIFRLLIVLLVCTFLAASLSSCSVFQPAYKTRTESFKIKKPLPKKWIIHNGKEHPISIK